MGQIIKTPPVKLIVGLIFKEESRLSKAESALIRSFGRIDFQSSIMDFNYTDYYEKEFGKGLKRKIISFSKLVDPARITNIKIKTNKIEERLSNSKRRTVNIDPGYLDLSKLVLATTKDFAHRIYLNNGIYAEITLSYRGNTFRPCEWTYPDYRTAEYIKIFNQIRGNFRNQANR